MNLGNNLFNARKKKGMSQEEVSEKLGVSRQTISKWELGETLPDIYQSKKLANLYGMTLDELVEYDIDMKEIQEAIDKTSDALTEKIDWTKAWSKKYPILATYQKEVETERYAVELSRLLDDLQKRYGYDELNAMLVLKDILAAVWKSRKGSVKNFVALVKNGSFLVRITDMTILIEKEFIYGSSKRPNPTDYYRKQHYQCG